MSPPLIKMSGDELAISCVPVCPVRCWMQRRHTDLSTETTTTQTAASPTITEQFDGVVPVGGSKFYSFTTSTYGTINVTLTAVGGSLRAVDRDARRRPRTAIRH